MKTYTVRLVIAKPERCITKTVQAYSISHAVAEAVRGMGNVTRIAAQLGVEVFQPELDSDI